MRLIWFLSLATMTIASHVLDYDGPLLPTYFTEQEVGHRVPGDYMIGSEIIWEPSKIGQTIRVNRTLAGLNGSVISQLRLIDKDTEGFGAAANVTEGGPGKSSATVEFTSQNGHGIYYIAELYGKIENCQ